MAPPTASLQISTLAWDSKKHVACEISVDQTASWIARGEIPVWMHVDASNSQEAVAFLKDHLHIDEFDAEDIVSPLDRPHLRVTDGALILSVGCPRYDSPKVFFDEVGFILRSGLLVTVTTTRVPRIEAERNVFRQCGTRLGKTPSALLHTLLDAIVDDYFPIVDVLEDQVDELESLILEGNVAGLKSVLRLKRRLFEMRRNLGPIRDILNGLVRRDVTLISNKDRGHFMDVYDHTLRLMETVDLNIDMLTGIVDVQLAVQDNKLNLAMRTLTVVATLLMSASFVTGLYGMNFKYMPELALPWAYPAALALIVVILLAEVAYFKRKGWFS